MKTWQRNTMILTAGTILGLLLLLSGCSTAVPVTVKFPTAPANATSCPQLHKLEDSVKLSDIANTVNSNYSMYYECSVKVDTWNEWYQTQKQIFEKVK